MLNVPMTKEVMHKKYHAVLNFIGSLGLIGCGGGASRDAEGAIKVMQTAWEKMVKDPKFLADAKKRKLRVIAADAATIQKAVNDAVANADPATVKLAAKLVQEGGCEMNKSQQIRTTISKFARQNGLLFGGPFLLF